MRSLEKNYLGAAYRMRADFSRKKVRETVGARDIAPRAAVNPAPTMLVPFERYLESTGERLLYSGGRLNFTQNCFEQKWVKGQST